MVAKIFGVIFILAGIGNFIGVLGGASDPGDIIYGIGFIGLGIFLFSRGQKKKESKQEIQKNE